MIKVTGTAKIKVDFTVELDMTEAEFDTLSEREQNELMDQHIDWLDACRNGEVDDIWIDELEELEESA